MHIISFLIQIFSTIRLVFGLILDPRIHWAIRLIPILAIAYVLSPVDLIPDFIIGLGQIDDVAILFAATKIFLLLSRSWLGKDALDQLWAVNARRASAWTSRGRGSVVDAGYHFVDGA